MSTQLAQIDTKPIENKLAALNARAQAIVVSDQPTYVEARQIELDAKAYIKSVGHELDPGIESARSHLDLLRNQKNKFTEPAKAVLDIVARKANDWTAEERRKAKIEEDRINEQRRIEAARAAEVERKERERQAEIDRKAREKELEAQRKAGEIGKREAERLKKEAAEAAEREKVQAAKDAKEAAANVQEVRVAPSTPKVAGIKSQQYFFAEVTDESAIIRAFLAGDSERRAFLRQFITVDAQAVGRFARDTKDCDKAASLVPGCKFTSKG